MFICFIVQNSADHSNPSAVFGIQVGYLGNRVIALLWCRVYRLLEMVASSLLMLCFDTVLLLRSASLFDMSSTSPLSDDHISLCVIRLADVEQRVRDVRRSDRNRDDDCICVMDHPHDDIRFELCHDQGRKDHLDIRRRYVRGTSYPPVVGVSQTGECPPSKVVDRLCHYPRRIGCVCMYGW